MTQRNFPLRASLMGLSILALSACVNDQINALDWDLRSGGTALNTTDAARAATADRPAPDARGIITYPTYQVAVGQRGDTVATVAQRVGLDANSLAQFNGLTTGDTINAGEVLVLPTRVAGAAPTATTAAAAGLDVTAVATTALDRVGTTTLPAAAPPAAAAASGAEPVRHQVKRGETAFTIARTYNVSARALAEWNGLNADLAVREGQYLLIPTAAPGARPPAAPEGTVATTAPGAGTPTPTPPSASQPLPDEDTTPVAEAPENVPASPELAEDRTAASSTSMTMPAQGSIIRGYAKGRNEGIDIGAAAGSPVVAAASGTVAAITQDTQQVPIIVLRHADGLLTVYAGVDGITVAKGAQVERGQQIAVVRAANPAFLHF
ncbi:MAG: LysM peptidoglycan-binding domain-containing protein, partial [Paracoccaceae bacterium]